MAEVITWEQLTTMTCRDDQETTAFQALIMAIDLHFPSDWRTWKLNNYTFQDLFGEAISQNIDSKIRFAIPIVDLVRIFRPSADSVLERRYGEIKRRLLDWPLGRSLVYAPHHVMEKIHGPDYDKFINTVRELKPKLLNRDRASSLLRELASSRHSDRSTVSSVGHRKRHRSGTPDIEYHSPPKRVSTPILATAPDGTNLLVATLNKQMEMFNKLLTASSEHSKILNKLVSRERYYNTKGRQDVLDASFESVPDSTHCNIEGEVTYSPTSARSVASSQSQESILRDQIADAQRRLAELKSQSSPRLISKPIFNFSPFTTEREPRVAKADPELLKQGILCQRFRDENWRNVRYADTQKTFHAAPAFSSLKTNNILAGATPQFKSISIVEDFDMTLGA